MIRTRYPNSPRAWEVFTPGGWEVINPNTWQGWHKEGVGGQLIKLWHKEEYCPYLHHPKGGQVLGFRIVYHQGTQQWIAFGYANQGTRTLCYTLSDSLFNPNWDKYGISKVEDGLNGEYAVLGQSNYPSIVDPTSEDYVFQFTGNNPFLYFIEPNSASANKHSRNVWRVPLRIEG